MFFEALVFAFTVLDAFEDDAAAHAAFLLLAIFGAVDDATTKDVAVEFLSEDLDWDNIAAALADANESVTLGSGSWDDDSGVFDAVD